MNRRELANAIRALSMDAVQKANSGHPGAPMGMADVAEVLWNDFLKHNPANPLWSDRDRFVLSNGHASMLLYALLHLSGYDMTIADLKAFRQLDSRTPGHPEYGLTPGVETTTGPLGQGLANAVGMALAERALATHFNCNGHKIVDHYTYAIVGDGCLMEGISHEASSFAGLQGLGKLIVLYDDNSISIDGDVAGWFRDNTPKRFEAYGWHVVPAVDGHDPVSIRDAIEAARGISSRPSLICCKTIIGWGSPNKQGSEESHGAPLGEDEVALVRDNIDWNHPPFVIPDEIYSAWNATEKGAQTESEWRSRFAAYRDEYPDLAEEFERRLSGKLPQEWDEISRTYVASTLASSQAMATRKHSHAALNNLGAVLPELIGGSADLTGSNLTLRTGSTPLNPENPDGNYIYYGVREFAMSALNNGMALHGGFIPYGATFLMFCEYAFNALRMAALMSIRNIFVYSHDSIGVGEDGPTHQPVEQVSNLRRIPNMRLWRPCDALESAVAWKSAIERDDGPSCLIFTRQEVNPACEAAITPEQVACGGYIRQDCEGVPEAIIIATGSEVPLAIGAANDLTIKGRRVRVVSMPSTHVFDTQDERYRHSVIPPEVTTRIAIEAGLTDGWHRYVGDRGAIIGIDGFGASAPWSEAFSHFGFTVDQVVKTLEDMLVA